MTVGIDYGDSLINPIILDMVMSDFTELNNEPYSVKNIETNYYDRGGELCTFWPSAMRYADKRNYSVVIMHHDTYGFCYGLVIGRRYYLVSSGALYGNNNQLDVVNLFAETVCVITVLQPTEIKNMWLDEMVIGKIYHSYLPEMSINYFIIRVDDENVKIITHEEQGGSPFIVLQAISSTNSQNLCSSFVPVTGG